MIGVNFTRKVVLTLSVDQWHLVGDDMTKNMTALSLNTRLGDFINNNASEHRTRQEMTWLLNASCNFITPKTWDTLDEVLRTVYQEAA